MLSHWKQCYRIGSGGWNSLIHVHGFCARKQAQDKTLRALLPGHARPGFCPALCRLEEEGPFSTSTSSGCNQNMATSNVFLAISELMLACPKAAEGADSGMWG